MIRSKLEIGRRHLVPGPGSHLSGFDLRERSLESCGIENEGGKHGP